MTQMQEAKTKAVYTIVERQQKSRWVRIGIGFVNRDGSINVRLDAVPVNGKLHLRDYRKKDDDSGEADSDSPLPRSADGSRGGGLHPVEPGFESFSGSMGTSPRPSSGAAGFGSADCVD